MTRRQRRALALLATCALCVMAVAASVAVASGPPKGHYDCYQVGGAYGQTYVGSFTLKSGGRYTGQGSRHGSGRYGVGGSGLTFKTGPFKPWSGKVTRNAQHRLVVYLTLKKNHSIKQDCRQPKK